MVRFTTEAMNAGMNTELDVPLAADPQTRESGPAVVRVAILMDHALATSALSQLVAATTDLKLAATQSDADVLVVDLDGVTLPRDADAGTHRPAMVGLTARTTPEPIVESLQAGVACVVSTAAPLAELLRAIRLAAAGEMYFDGRIANVLVSRLRARAKPAHADDQRARFTELSEREQTVLRLVAEGRTGPEIGRLLGITAKTVDTYRHRIHEKIGLMHRRDYIHFALQIGLLES